MTAAEAIKHETNQLVNLTQHKLESIAKDQSQPISRRTAALQLLETRNNENP